MWVCVQGTTYKAAFHLDLTVQEGPGAPVVRLNRLMGHLPIMVGSKACYLRNLSPCAPLCPVLPACAGALSVPAVPEHVVCAPLCHPQLGPP